MIIFIGLLCLGILAAVFLFWPFEEKLIESKDLLQLSLERANTKQ